MRHTLLSGVEVNVNQRPTTTYLASVLTYQEFDLPANYTRGENFNPDLSGVQVCVQIPEGQEDNLLLEVDLQSKRTGVWTSYPQAHVTVTQAHTSGDKVWVNCYFSDVVPVPEPTADFRLGIKCNFNIWLAPPTPLQLPGFNGNTVPLFRILTMSADSGVDWLGNTYRSAVSRNAVAATSTVATDQENNYWLSKPNPSKYAVESLYFDVSSDLGKAAVVDRVLVDPITPGVFFNLYFSSEGVPATTEEEWESKLWSPIYQTFRMQRRQEHVLSTPIAARYLKVEFTHLQPQHYAPGTFQQPIRYKKHPKWVLDYYLARLNSESVTDDPLTAKRVRVVYDALNLAYDYYMDDLNNEPVIQTPSNNTGSIVSFLDDRNDASDRIDSDTLERISVEMQPFTRQPADRVRGLESVLAGHVQTYNRLPSYPTERINRYSADTTQVSTLDRLSLIVENDYPVMSFFVKSRHGYRVVEATFENDSAYFVGVREIAFTRDHYTVAADQSVYVDNLSDFNNVVRNDFIEEDYLPFEANPHP